jgi:hypothetical protein
MERVRAGYAAGHGSRIGHGRSAGPGGEQAARPRPGPAAAPPNDVAPPQTEVTLTVNGREERLAVDNRSTLLDVLRERLGLIVPSPHTGKPMAPCSGPIGEAGL